MIVLPELKRGQRVQEQRAVSWLPDHRPTQLHLPVVSREAGRCCSRAGHRGANLECKDSCKGAPEGFVTIERVDSSRGHESSIMHEVQEEWLRLPLSLHRPPSATIPLESMTSPSSLFPNPMNCVEIDVHVDASDTLTAGTYRLTHGRGKAASMRECRSGVVECTQCHWQPPLFPKMRLDQWQ